MMKLIAASLLCLIALSVNADTCYVAGYSQAYDKHFRVAVRLYWTYQYHDWCWLKAQAITESALTPTAVSSAGAQGILQIMPATWRDLQRQARVDGNVFEARANIIQSARYMRRMLDFWLFQRPARCRLELAQASYNAGAGNILDAQGLAGGSRCWDGIAPHLNRVTGHHSVETIQYVVRIARWRESMQ